jgi:hypothetical protein
MIMARVGSFVLTLEALQNREHSAGDRVDGPMVRRTGISVALIHIEHVADKFGGHPYEEI